MAIFYSIKESFKQLGTVLADMSAEQYVHPSAYLSNATIGQHTRHIIEMYQCLLAGYERGILSYDERKRDVVIETDVTAAVRLLQEIPAQVQRPDKSLVLHAAYGDSSASATPFNTSYYRELAFNLDHTIHHMALIKVGLQECSQVQVPAGFGVASSTVRFRHHH